MKRRIMFATGLALFTLVNTSSGDIPPERLAIRESIIPHESTGRSGFCSIIYYNLCSGWVWMFTGWDPGDEVGVIYDLPSDCGKQPDEYCVHTHSWWYWRYTNPGYGHTMTLSLFNVDSLGNKIGPPVDVFTGYDPTEHWNYIPAFSGIITSKRVAVISEWEADNIPYLVTHHNILNQSAPIACPGYTIGSAHSFIYRQGGASYSPPLAMVDTLLNGTTVGPVEIILKTGFDCQPMMPFEILDIQDVGNDQGGYVRIRWNRHPYDVPLSDTTITGYAVYRRQDQYFIENSLRNTEERLSSDKEGGRREDGWDFIQTIPARADSVYQVVAPTLCDSTEAEGICWSVFFISAMTPVPWTYYDSNADSGYSIDNLAPAVPINLTWELGAESILLSWTPNAEEDLAYYAVYRDTIEGFLLDEPIGYSTLSHFQDDDLPIPGTYWYRITAVDLSGNESEGTEAVGGIATGVENNRDRLTNQFRFGSITPNPFNPSVRIEISIPPHAPNIELNVYDVKGRVVRNLLDDTRATGVYHLEWDGTDDYGSSVASGVYFCRLKMGERQETKRMVLIR